MKDEEREAIVARANAALVRAWRTKRTGVGWGPLLTRAVLEEAGFFDLLAAADDWLAHLQTRGARYLDGIPGELMDAVERCKEGPR